MLNNHKLFIQKRVKRKMNEENLCENCLENEAKLDSLIDGEFKRLCSTCSMLDGAVNLPGPSKVDISSINARRTVKEILMGMSGIKKPGIKKKEVHLDDLWRVKKERENADKKFGEDMKHLNDPDNPKSVSTWVLGKAKLEVAKNKKPNPHGVSLSETKEDDVIDI